MSSNSSGKHNVALSNWLLGNQKWLETEKGCLGIGSGDWILRNRKWLEVQKAETSGDGYSEMRCGNIVRGVLSFFPSLLGHRSLLCVVNELVGSICCAQSFTLVSVQP
jgi:hypothetical protein